MHAARRRSLHALTCLLAFSGGVFLTLALLALSATPTFAENYDDAQSLKALRLLNGQRCGVPVQVAQAQPAASPSPSAPASPSASPSPGPTFTPVPVFGVPVATPFPRGTPPVTPLPIPTATPASTASPGPVYLVRPSATPSIAPAGPGAPPSPSPSPTPTGVPTLRPGQVAVMADKVTGSTKPGVPGDAIGNVHIYYQDEVLVGDRAHYDGIRTITVTGNPYIINNAKNSILYADKITFDTVAEKAYLYNGRGQSSQGVERGLVYYSAKDLHTDQHGVSHGDFASATTCDRPRAGYHITGRTIDVYPGDKIVINKAILWLGAAAVFWLPHVVIPLRTVSAQQRRPQYFPIVGYSQVQGYYMLARLIFGKDRHYYGYYDVDFYTKQGLTLGYDGTIAPVNGKRTTHVNFQRIQNKLQKSTQYNVAATDRENFSQTLQGTFDYSYQGNYGPLTNFAPTTRSDATVTHQHGTATQTYTFSRTNTAGQSNSRNFGFTDTRNFGTYLQNNLVTTLGQDSSLFGGQATQNSTGAITDQFHWASHAADYLLTFDKKFSKHPYTYNKEPELQVRPALFMPHFVFPIAPTLTIGQYNEPQTPETTMRADVGLQMGPLLYNSALGQFTGNVTVHQYAYGTGDLKASVQQTMSLTSEIGSHITNSLTYNESNYNGPATVPFTQIDLQPTTNNHTASDIIHFFNNDVYDLGLTFTTAFDRRAQPVAYNLGLRPTHKSYLSLQGSFTPGSGYGFDRTSFNLLTPLGIGGWLTFGGDLDWKNKARIENKSVYYSRIIGDCYELQLQYNQNARTVNVTLNILAFPSKGIGFGLNTNGGSIIPSNFNGLGNITY